MGGLIFLVLVAIGALSPNPIVLLAGVAANLTEANGFTVVGVDGLGVLPLEANDAFAKGFGLDAGLGAAAVAELVGALAGVGAAGIGVEGVLMPVPFFHFELTRTIRLL